jgi:hypothetical protein
MNGKDIVKRLTIAVTSIPLLLTLNSSNINKKDKDYFRNRTKITEHVIDYGSGTIYIGNSKYVESIEGKELGRYDIIALDERDAEDPNIRVYNSYRIFNGDIREEIIEALLMYEEEYPTKWDRTKNSLLREWTAHNYGYRLGYQHDSTTDVDFNNDDEMNYRFSKILSR